MPGGRERNILRWELRESLLRGQVARLDERLERLGDISDPNISPEQRTKRDDLLAQRAQLAHELDALGPNPRAKMG